MAVFVATDYDIVIGGTNLSDRITAVDLPVEVDTQESTNFDSSGWKENTPGLKSGSITIGFNQDFAASETDATLWPLLGTATTIVVKPTSSAVGSTNPSFTGSFVVTSLTPVAGKVGDLATQNVTWPLTGALTRATS